MNTGADDDSRNTPIFAFSTSSARAIPLAANASKPAIASRKIPVIRLPPPLLCSEPLGDLLVLPDKGPLVLQRLLQLFDRNVAWIRIAAKRQRRGGAGGL